MSMAFKIENNIPLPTNWREKTGVTSALRALGVGQSVVLPFPRRRSSLAGIISNTGKQIGARFTTRTITIDGEKKIRVWRVE